MTPTASPFCDPSCLTTICSSESGRTSRSPPPSLVECWRSCVGLILLSTAAVCSEWQWPPRSQNTVLPSPPPHPLFLESFPFHFPCCSLGLGGHGVDAPCRAEHSTVTTSQHFWPVTSLSIECRLLHREVSLLKAGKSSSPWLQMRIVW